MIDHDRAMAHLRRFGLKEPAGDAPDFSPCEAGGVAQRAEGGAVHRFAFDALSLPVRVSLADPCQILDRLGKQVAVVDHHRDMPDATAAAIAAMVVAAVNALGGEGR